MLWHQWQKATKHASVFKLLLTQLWMDKKVDLVIIVQQDVEEEFGFKELLSRLALVQSTVFEVIEVLFSFLPKGQRWENKHESDPTLYSSWNMKIFELVQDTCQMLVREWQPQDKGEVQGHSWHSWHQLLRFPNLAILFHSRKNIFYSL